MLSELPEILLITVANYRPTTATPLAKLPLAVATARPSSFEWDIVSRV